MIRLTFNTRGLDELIRLADRGEAIALEETEAAMHRAVLITEAEVVKEMPVDTGRARASVATEVTRSGRRVRGRVFSQGAAHVDYLESGTGIYHEPGPRSPWRVTARRARALKIRLPDGRVIFRRSATIKGMRPRKPFAKGLARATPRLERLFQRAADRAARRIAGRG